MQLPMRPSLVLLAAGLLVACSAAAQEPAKHPEAAPTVLFVCEHGAAKSVIAAAHFNKLAKERGLPHRAIARGTNPDANMAPVAVQGLLADGLDAPSSKPTQVTTKDIDGASRVVAFQCELPKAAPDKTAQWSDVPSVSQDYGTARSDIVKRVEKLVDALAKDKNR